ncbi:hypothetical protein FQR65_LT20281 [Abscondita terminalis]|nr:hypothetical protein FQR65_LT20281 [Abscondita terminalis]
MPIIWFDATFGQSRLALLQYKYGRKRIIDRTDFVCAGLFIAAAADNIIWVIIRARSAGAGADFRRGHRLIDRLDPGRAPHQGDGNGGRFDRTDLRGVSGCCPIANINGSRMGGIFATDPVFCRLLRSWLLYVVPRPAPRPATGTSVDTRDPGAWRADATRISCICTAFDANGDVCRGTVSLDPFCAIATGRALEDLLAGGHRFFRTDVAAHLHRQPWDAIPENTLHAKRRSRDQVAVATTETGKTKTAVTKKNHELGTASPSIANWLEIAGQY